jgi:hypothetical protein
MANTNYHRHFDVVVFIKHHTDFMNQQTNCPLEIIICKHTKQSFNLGSRYVIDGATTMTLTSGARNVVTVEGAESRRPFTLPVNAWLQFIVIELLTTTPSYHVQARQR